MNEYLASNQCKTPDLTFCMIKPDATARNLTGKIIADIEALGFEIIDLKRKVLSYEEAASLYTEHREKSHFQDLVDYTCSGPSVVMILRKKKSDKDASGCPQHDSTAGRLRHFLGDSSPDLWQPWQLRGKYGISMRQNAIHASRTKSDAAREAAIFFTYLQ